MGGVKKEDSKADLSVVFHFLPKYPMFLNLWYSDDEFPASGKVLINSGVQAHLGVEAAGTLATVLVIKMIDIIKVST